MEIQTLAVTGVGKRGEGEGEGEGEEGKQLCQTGIKWKIKTSSKDLRLYADFRQPIKTPGPKKQ